MIPKPVVSLHGNGESIVLDNRAGDFVLMQGATGLGWGPQEITSAALPQGGSVLRHQRTAEADVVVPFLLGGDYYARRDARRQLERLCDGEVEIRVTQPDGLVRSRFGYYSDGLEGAYGSGEDSQDGQKLSLTIKCLDPWWYGDDRGESFVVKSQRKPFITGVSGDSYRTNYAPNPGFEYVSPLGWSFTGWADSTQAIDTSQKKSGTRSLKVMSAGGSSTPHIVLPIETIPDVTTVTKGVQLMATQGVTHYRLQWWQELDGYMSPVGSNQVVAASTDWQRVTLSRKGIESSRVAVQIQMLRSIGGVLQDVPEGEAMWVDESITETGSYVGAYFDGDSEATGKAYAWPEGVGGISTETAASTVGSLPFFPIRLSSSTVQGTYEVTVQGDRTTYGIATITGPGEDVMITNAEGESIFIEGQVTEPIVIDSRPLHYDVTSQGQDIWARVTGEPSVLTMKPGVNTFQVSMVNASSSSRVQIDYRETWKAGQ